MGKDSLLIIMVAEAVGLAALCMLLHRLSRFTKRTWDDVPEFLRHINHEAVERLFDPREEAEALAFGNPRRALRARLDLAREYVRSLHHNATIVYQWGNTEWSDMVRHNLDYDQETREKLLALHREAITFLVAARVVLVKIWLLGVLQSEHWPLRMCRSVATLARPGSLDLLHSYQRVKQAASALASIYGDEHSEEITELM